MSKTGSNFKYKVQESIRLIDKNDSASYVIRILNILNAALLAQYDIKADDFTDEAKEQAKEFADYFYSRGWEHPDAMENMMELTWGQPALILRVGSTYTIKGSKKIIFLLLPSLFSSFRIFRNFLRPLPAPSH